MERSHHPTNASSQYSSQNLIPKSSTSFLNSDDSFSFQPRDDSFLITPNHHHHIISPLPLPLPPPSQYFPHHNHASLDTPYAHISWGEDPTPPPLPPPYISFGGSAGGIDPISHEEARKKIHRELERQRRQGMNSLFCSLRSLLPLESVKGKRSTSDHVNETFNYINHLRGRIKDLEAKRDKLRRKSSFVALQQESSGSEASPVNRFIVRPFLDGIEVVIQGEFSEQDVPLSRILQLLAREGVSVVNCMYTRNNDITIYNIKSEACDPGSFDIARLQWKLGELLNW